MTSSLPNRGRHPGPGTVQFTTAPFEFSIDPADLLDDIDADGTDARG